MKLHGGAIGREHGYGSGVLVSSDGLIVTTAAAMLESPALRCVLADGRRFPAKITARDEEHQLVLLKIDADGLPFFELGESSRVLVGDWVVAAANPFKVAQGNEPVSFMVGILSGRTVLAARRRAQDFPYRGPILLLDMIVATPGSSGGAVVDLDGRLVGLIGRPVIGAQTNTWLNYALPVEVVTEFLRAADAGELAQPAPAAASRPHGLTPEDLGLRLFDVGGRVRPAYIERVRGGSPAALAGLRADDLVLSVGGRATATCDELRETVASLQPGSTVALVVKRGEQVLELTLTTTEPAQ
ncbi:MAG: serine protease [Phycisphaerae bacterium]